MDVREEKMMMMMTATRTGAPPTTHCIIDAPRGPTRAYARTLLISRSRLHRRTPRLVTHADQGRFYQMRVKVKGEEMEEEEGEGSVVGWSGVNGSQ